MSAYIPGRIVSMVPLLRIVSIIAFGLLYVLPGDPAVAILGDNAGNQQTYLVLQMIQQMVDKIGVKLKLDVVERVAWGEKVRIQNDFQMASRLSGVAVDPTDDLLLTWAEGGNSAYHRAKVAGLIDTLHQADAEYDRAKRQELFVNAQKLMYQSAWFGYIWFEPGNFLVHKRIQGFPAAWGSLRESEWWINES